VIRSVRVPCPRCAAGGAPGGVEVSLEPETGDPLGEEGWWAWIIVERGPRGGHPRRHCDAGCRLSRQEVDAVRLRACAVYEAYLAQGGGLRPEREEEG
jgi:hypothetical protein